VVALMAATCNGTEGLASITHHPRQPRPRQAPHYDIREIDEDLYLAVLACRRAKTAGHDSDPAAAADQPQGTVGDCKGP
jgi:hypothetical protein